MLVNILFLIGGIVLGLTLATYIGLRFKIDSHGIRFFFESEKPSKRNDYYYPPRYKKGK